MVLVGFNPKRFIIKYLYKAMQILIDKVYNISWYIIHIRMGFCPNHFTIKSIDINPHYLKEGRYAV